ncbi:cupin domain-containing protein [Mesorhizobium marinum]|uniref:cupin domain-containing protein n=1 Tax=Mesorhizobium marinum TaxID=3228790 RepID=UPI003466909B
MRTMIVIAALAAGALIAPAYALDSGGQPVVVTPIRSTTVTSTGQPIRLPDNNVEVTASIFEIAPGVTLPVHKHPYARYGYVLAGSLKVTNVDTGQSDVFNTGDFIVEMTDQWHQGSNIGSTPVKLLVIDQIVAGTKATVLKE